MMQSLGNMEIKLKTDKPVIPTFDDGMPSACPTCKWSDIADIESYDDETVIRIKHDRLSKQIVGYRSVNKKTGVRANLRFGVNVESCEDLISIVIPLETNAGTLAYTFDFNLGKVGNWGGGTYIGANDASSVRALTTEELAAINDDAAATATS